MVYAMICYNISLNTGGMSNSVFLAAFHELIIMWPVAFLLEFLFVDKAAHALAFRFVKPDDRPIIITLAISTMIICIMCPCMSLVAAGQGCLACLQCLQLRVVAVHLSV